MNNNRQKFLAVVKRALENQTHAGLSTVDDMAPSTQLVPSDPPDLLDLLSESAMEANIQLVIAADDRAASVAIEEIARQTTAEWENQDAVIAWDHPLLHRLDLESVFGKIGLEFYQVRAPTASHLTEDDRSSFRTQLEQCMLGITSADYCIADTATLVMRNQPGQPGAVSLVPSVHVAVIKASQVLSDFVSFYALLEEQYQTDPEVLTHRMTLISGPSKTGDIELVMVQGAHGPRALHLVVVDDLTAARTAEALP